MCRLPSTPMTRSLLRTSTRRISVTTLRLYNDESNDSSTRCCVRAARFACGSRRHYIRFESKKCQTKLILVQAETHKGSSYERLDGDRTLAGMPAHGASRDRVRNPKSRGAQPIIPLHHNPAGFTV